jgi:hypothetical protein
MECVVLAWEHASAIEGSSLFQLHVQDSKPASRERRCTRFKFEIRMRLLTLAVGICLQHWTAIQAQTKVGATCPCEEQASWTHTWTSRSVLKNDSDKKATKYALALQESAPALTKPIHLLGMAEIRLRCALYVLCSI